MSGAGRRVRIPGRGSSRTLSRRRRGITPVSGRCDFPGGSLSLLDWLFCALLGVHSNNGGIWGTFNALRTSVSHGSGQVNAYRSNRLGRHPLARRPRRRDGGDAISPRPAPWRAARSAPVPRRRAARRASPRGCASTRSASAAIHIGCSLRHGITWNSLPPAARKFASLHADFLERFEAVGDESGAVDIDARLAFLRRARRAARRCTASAISPCRSATGT